MPLNDFCRELLPAISGLDLSPDQKNAFSALYDRVQAVNSVMNITALHDMCDIALKHFTDSLTLVSDAGLSRLDSATMLDVGCGGGFPGLPVKLALPGMRITMLDSTEKKVRSVEETACLLGLSGMSFISGRAEELGRADNPSGMRESFDFVTSRAVARLGVLTEICLPFVKNGGRFLAMKGATAEEELAEAKRGITRLGGKVAEMIDCRRNADDILAVLPAHTVSEEEKMREFCSSGRYIIVIEKILDTPLNYPRGWAQITKKPL